MADNGFFKKDRPTPDMVREGMPPRENGHALRGPKEYGDELPMLLGNQLPNPYTTANMAAAYNLIFGTSYTELPATDLYVRFEPVTDAQVAVLEDSLDLDVFDHPLDHELLQDGDYYVHPGKTVEDLPLLYTTVKPDFQFPAGIPYTVLAHLHLPGDDNLFLEQLAESMAGGAAYARSANNGTAVLTRTDIPEMPSTGIPACDFEDPLDPGTSIPCPPSVPDPGGDGTVCGLPALRCFEQNRPKGRLRVWDTQKEACVPLVNAQITCKRWFKGIRRRVYTDAEGNFAGTQRFNGRVKVVVHFRNNTVSVRPLRNNFGIRLSLLPLRHNLGVFSGCDMNRLDQVYYRGDDRTTKAFARWLGAHAINARNDQWNAAVAPSSGLKVFDGHRLVLYLARGGAQYNRRPEAELLLQSYLYKNKTFTDWYIDVQKLAGYVLDENPVAAAVQYYNMILGGQRPDIVYRYNTLWENLSSSEVNQQFYSVYAQAGLLKAVDAGNSNVKWKHYFKAKSKDIDASVGALGGWLGTLSKIVRSALPAATNAANPNSSGLNGMYTAHDGSSFSAATLASMVLTLGQQVYYSVTQPDREFYYQVKGFGEYYGHWLANERYGTLADAILNQKREKVSGDLLQSSHIKYLEGWNPNEPLDEFIYDKEGLFNDLEDANSTPPEKIPLTQIEDLVSGIKAKDYEKAIMGGAMYANPVLWDQCRDNLKQVFPLQEDKIVNLYRAYNVW